MFANAKLVEIAGEVTTQLRRGKGGGTFPRSRPVYVDMLYSAALTIAGVTMAAVFVK